MVTVSREAIRRAIGIVRVSQVNGREGDSFEKVSAPRVVPEIGLIAEPGRTGPPVRLRIPADAEPGEYRVVIQRGVPDVGVLSGDLTVTAGD